MRASYALLPLILAGFLQGCAAPKAEWINDRNNIHCLNETIHTCLPKFAKAYLAIWSDSELTTDAPEGLSNLIIASSLYGDSSLGMQPPDRAELAVAMKAGQLVARYMAEKSDESFSELLAIEEPVIKVRTLLSLWLVSHDSLPRPHVSELLSNLYALDPEIYAQAQAARLPTLLSLGDLERASALRDELLAVPSSPVTSLTMPTYICGVYAAAGLEADAVSILRKAVGEGMVPTADDLQTVKMMTRIGKGDYPLPQEFMFFEDDQKRADVYALIAQVAFANGLEKRAESILRDGVMFIQKTSFRGDLPQSLAKLIITSVSTSI